MCMSDCIFKQYVLPPFNKYSLEENIDLKLIEWIYMQINSNPILERLFTSHVLTMRFKCIDITE